MSNHPCIQSEKIGAHSAKIDNLERWQKTQNGQLKLLNDKIDNLRTWLTTILGLLALNLLLVIITLVSKLAEQGRGGFFLSLLFDSFTKH